MLFWNDRAKVTFEWYLDSSILIRSDCIEVIELVARLRVSVFIVLVFLWTNGLSS